MVKVMVVGGWGLGGGGGGGGHILYIIIFFFADDSNRIVYAKSQNTTHFHQLWLFWNVDADPIQRQGGGD